MNSFNKTQKISLKIKKTLNKNGEGFYFQPWIAQTPDSSSSLKNYKINKIHETTVLSIQTIHSTGLWFLKEGKKRWKVLWHIGTHIKNVQATTVCDTNEYIQYMFWKPGLRWQRVHKWSLELDKRRGSWLERNTREPFGVIEILHILTVVMVTQMYTPVKTH